MIRLLVPRLHGTRLLGGPRTDGQSREGQGRLPQPASHYYLRLPPPPNGLRVSSVLLLPPLALLCDWISSKQIGSLAAARTSFLHATSDTQSFSPERLFIWELERA